MQLSLRPYLTAGVAIAGASVIAVAPIQPTPTDIQIPNPIAQVERDVQLTGNEIDDSGQPRRISDYRAWVGPIVPGTAVFIDAYRTNRSCQRHCGRRGGIRPPGSLGLSWSR